MNSNSLNELKIEKIILQEENIFAMLAVIPK